MEFEWDLRKEAANRRKHGVGFDEALTVFANPLARIFNDPNHAAEEAREIMVGHSARQQLMVVCFTERSGRVRLISARIATKRERRDYEENTP